MAGGPRTSAGAGLWKLALDEWRWSDTFTTSAAFAVYFASAPAPQRPAAGEERRDALLEAGGAVVVSAALGGALQRVYSRIQKEAKKRALAFFPAALLAA